MPASWLRGFFVLSIGIHCREIAWREADRRGGSEEEPLINSLLLLDVPEASSSASPVLLGELGINGGSGESSSEGTRVVRVSSMVMKKLTGLQSTDSTEAVAVMKIPSSFHDVGGRPREAAGCSSWFSSPPRRLLVLDGIQVFVLFSHKNLENFLI